MDIAIEYLTTQLSLLVDAFKDGVLIPLLIAAILVPLAYLWMGSRGVRSWRDFREFVLPSRLLGARTIKIDALMVAVGLILVGPLTKVLTLTLAVQLFCAGLSQLIAQPPVTISEPGLVILLQLSTVFFFQEFGVWWGHYLHHKVPFLWEVHRAHHSAEALVFISGHRRHPLEPLLTRPLFSIVLPAIPVSAVVYCTGGQLHPVVLSTLVTFGMAIGVLDKLHHCPVPISFGPLSRFFSSPAMHQIHHSAEPQHRDKNMGSWSAIFDWMFGTLYIPSRGEQWRYGSSADELGERNPHLTVKGFFLGPVVGFGKGVMASVLPGQRGTSRSAAIVGSPAETQAK